MSVRAGRGNNYPPFDADGQAMATESSQCYLDRRQTCVIVMRQENYHLGDRNANIKNFSPTLNPEGQIDPPPTLHFRPVDPPSPEPTNPSSSDRINPHRPSTACDLRTPDAQGLRVCQGQRRTNAIRTLVTPLIPNRR